MWLSFTVFIVLTAILCMLYVTLSLKDFVGDLKFVFERRFFRAAPRLVFRLTLFGAAILAISYGMELILSIDLVAGAIMLSLLSIGCAVIWIIGPKTFFDWPLIRRSMRQFSLMRMIQLVTACACFFALFQWLGGGVDGFTRAVLAVSPIVSVVVLYTIAFQDLSDDGRTRRARRQMLGQPRDADRKQGSGNDDDACQSPLDIQVFHDVGK